MNQKRKRKGPNRTNSYNVRTNKNTSNCNVQETGFDKTKSKSFSKFADGKTDMQKFNNDPHWYFKDQNVLESVASFSFNAALGNYINNSKMFPATKQSALDVSIPGLLTLEVAPVPGVAVDATSPINIGAQNVYSFVRYKNNANSAGVDAPDLMLYLLAMDSIYSAWNWMKRIYGFAASYSALNRYKPRAYMQANYIDMDDIYANLADFRGYLNVAAAKISAFNVPAVFNLMVRHSWLFSNVYKDSDTHKAQEYMYVPALFYQYDETSSREGGILSPVDICYTTPQKMRTFADLRRILDGMIDALTYSEDIGLMSGDILKAYGEGGLYKLSTIDPDYIVEAVYNKEVLTQVENAQYFQYPNYLTSANLDQFVIKQDPNTNFIKFQPNIDMGAGDYNTPYEGNYLNFHWDNPTPSDLMVSSRINQSWSVVASGSNHYLKLISCGSEMALRCCSYIFTQGTLDTEASIGTAMSISRFEMSSVFMLAHSASSSLQADDNTITTLITTIRSLMTFDWAPAIYGVMRSAAGNYYSFIPLRDWDVYTYVDTEDIESMNTLALMSEFNVPN